MVYNGQMSQIAYISTTDMYHNCKRLQKPCISRGVATGPVGPVSTGPLFGQLEIFSFAKVKIVTTDYRMRASALYIT